MNATPKPKRTFVAVTLVTVMAVTTVFLVYAAILATYIGGNVTVTEPGGSIQYTKINTSNSSWTSTIDVINGTSWYTRINITNSGAQTVTLNWRLLKNAVDQGIKVTTSNYALSAGTNTIYASTTGLFAGMYDWKPDTATSGTYQVKVEVNG